MPFTQLTDEEVAAVLLELDRRDLLLAGSKADIYAVFEEALEAKRVSDDPDYAPDTMMAAEAATSYGDLLYEASQMLVEREISHKRLEEIAEAGTPIAEKMVTLSFGT